MATRLRKETKDSIRDDNSLSLLVADELGISISTLPSYLTRDVRRLTEYPVLKIIADKTGKPIDELIEEYTEDEQELAEQSNH